MVVRVRFAPSPTGYLHIGGARTALFNYVFARTQGGTFILRIDDTDLERSKPEYESDILHSLGWLGIDWDEGPDAGGDFGPYRQSEKSKRYLEAVNTLLDNKYAFEDPDGSIRLRYTENEIAFDDVILGPTKFLAQSLGPEPVLLRANGIPTYHLASVVDDIDMKITHVLRGQDHVTNTAKHILICRGLGAEPMAFGHLPIILGDDGAKLSKRSGKGMTTVREFESGGYASEALNNFIMLLGWSHPAAEEILGPNEILSSFSLDRVRHTASIFETNKLDWLNGIWIRKLPAEEVVERGREFLGDYRELADNNASRWLKAVDGLRSDLSSFLDLPRIAKLLFDHQLSVSAEAKEAFSSDEMRNALSSVQAAWLELLHELPSDADNDSYSDQQFSQIMSLIKKKVDVKGKPLFQSIRMCVMADVQGPDLKVLVPLLPRYILLSRVEALKTELGLQ